MRLINIPELQNCLTFDVGKNTAVALWSGDCKPLTGSWSYKHKIKNDVAAYLVYMRNKMNSAMLAMGRQRYDFIQIEGVEVWENSSKSLTSATRGDLVALGYLVGVYFEIASKYTKDVRIIPAREWKGQLSKEGTNARVKRINGETYDNEHITDAVAMGFANVEDIWLLKRKVI